VSRIRQLGPILLVAVFWIAQVQGIAHAASHLGKPAGLSDRASVPHDVLCIECAAFAQAGAAPLLSQPTALAAAMAAIAVAVPLVPLIAADSLAAYHSRAPPPSPI